MTMPHPVFNPLIWLLVLVIWSVIFSAIGALLSVAV